MLITFTRGHLAARPARASGFYSSGPEAATAQTALRRDVRRPVFPGFGRRWHGAFCRATPLTPGKRPTSATRANRCGVGQSICQVSEIRGLPRGGGAGAHRGASCQPCAGQLEAGLSGRSRRLLLALPEILDDYRWDKFRARDARAVFSRTPRQLSRKELSGGVYRWHADNPTDHAVTVSVLLAWTNMLGWFRDYSQNIKDSLDADNVNHWVDTQEGAAGHMVGIVLDRVHLRPVEDEGDGQMAGRDPRVARSGGELSDHVPHRLGRRECDQNRQWRNLEIVFERWPAGQ
jgi:hypothetical protein